MEGLGVAPKAFGALSTTEEVLADVKLKDQRILATGVSAGRGVGTARSLAAHGAHVVRGSRRAQTGSTRLIGRLEGKRQ